MSNKDRSLRQVLDDQTNSLDNDIQQQLHKQRQQALDALPLLQPVSNKSLWLSAGLLMTAGLAAVIWINASSSLAPTADVNLLLSDTDILSAPDDLALYEDLELYAWLLEKKKS